MKTFILDTSVLLHHEDSIHGFPGSKVVLPIEVLEELDHFKDRHDIVGNASRYINRFVDDLRKLGNLQKGVKLENGQVFQISVDADISLLPVGMKDSRDNRILSVALKLSKKTKDDVILVSRDINMRIKCDVLGVKAENYIKEKANIRRKGAYSGVSVVNISTKEIDTFYKSGKWTPPEEDGMFPNECVVLKNGNSASALGITDDRGIVRKLYHAGDRSLSVEGIMARSKEQKFAFELLLNPDISMVTLTGAAGVGKTILTLAAALDQIHNKVYDQIVITRPVQSMSKDIGFLPGSKSEKMAPWIQPFTDNLKMILGRESGPYIDIMFEKGVIEVEALGYMRGRSMPRTFFILDEAQNITMREAKAVLTRMGEGSKIVLLGDLQQIDSPHINEATSGLSVVVERFKDWSGSGHITLIKGERSPLATHAAKIL